MTRITSRTLLGAAVAAGALTVAGVALAAGGSQRSTGPDAAYGESNPFADAAAAVHVVNTGNGTTVVSLHVFGVVAEPGRTFGAHVHQLPCGETGGAAGPHYLHAGAVGTLEEREVWLDVTVNAAGNGHTVTSRPWQIDTATPRSVILHALPTAVDGTAGARLACIDLDGD